MNRKKIKKLYEDYDYEEVYDQKITSEEDIEDLRINNNYVYLRRTIISGKIVEVEIYPIWKCRNDVPRKKKGVSREAQKKLNEKNSRKNTVRLINTNFIEKEDLYITLTYKDGYLPDEKRARKDIQNYIARLKRWRKRNGITEPLKYIYSIGFEDNPEHSKKIRIHHHLIINKINRDVAEDLWGKGRAESRRLKPDDFQFEGVGRYIASQGRERIGHSTNLEKPIVKKDRTRLTNRKAEKIVRNENDYKEYFEKKYEDCIYLDCNTYQSSEFPGVYFYARLRKKEVKNE